MFCTCVALFCTSMVPLYKSLPFTRSDAHTHTEWSAAALQSAAGPWGSSLGFSVLPKGTPTCKHLEPGFKPLLLDDPLRRISTFLALLFFKMHIKTALLVRLSAPLPLNDSQHPLWTAHLFCSHLPVVILHILLKEATVTNLTVWLFWYSIFFFFF